MLSVIIGQQEKFTGTKEFQGHALEKLGERVYSFRWTWYRNLVVNTDAGLFVVDPINPEAARLMQAAFAREFPGRPVHTLLYSHYHLDHATGAAALAPKRVVAHENCPRYWRDLGTKEVLPPTELLSGDRTLHVGGVEIRLLYLGKTHTDTLYAVHLPRERVLATTDFLLVRTVAPLGGPDYYFPGAFAAMDRLSKLDFDTFIPSHFGVGKKVDMLQSIAFFRRLRELSASGLKRYGKGGGRSLPTDSAGLKAIFGHVYLPMKAEFGHWHGFDEQSLMFVIRHMVGESIGF